jgi:HAD superfamily hydrolase (TIGR01509 family)
MKKVILFDLGDTLVRYWTSAEWPPLREQAIAGVQAELAARGRPLVEPHTLSQRVRAQDREEADYRVRPLAERLADVFQLDLERQAKVVAAACRAFMAPLFARGRPYDDVRPVLRRLRAEGVRAAIVSNTPWGSPGDLWREELARLGLAEEVDLAVFCTDVGWRKPAAAIFEYTLARLDARPADCFFVGDNPRWDVAGPRRVGIEALLLDRDGMAKDGDSIRDLYELWPRLWPGSGEEGG